MREDFCRKLEREYSRSDGRISDILGLIDELRTPEEPCDGDCAFCGNSRCKRRKGGAKKQKISAGGHSIDE